jgi:hypothetical protein
MKKTLLVSLCLVLSISLVASLAFAKNTAGKYSTYKPHRSVEKLNLPDQGGDQFQAVATATTTWLANYTWDSGPNCIDDGWVSTDLTAQLDDYWHVENFVGMGGNYQGHIGVLNGDQSLWCGQRASSVIPYCGYASLPGYANGWNQAFCTIDCVQYGDNAAVSFLADWDSEPGYDATTLEVTVCPGPENWNVIAGGTGDWDGDLDTYSTNGDTLITVGITDSVYVNNSIKVRLHFVADGAWSDEDGLWDTDGAIAIDDLEITGDSNSLPLEDFESPLAVGDTDGFADWENCKPIGYGDFAGIYNALTIEIEDPCTSNITCVWAFYNGSSANYGCGGFPAQTAVPYENLRGQYLNNEIWSPPFANIGSGVQYELQFDVYRDLPLDPLIFYVWHVRSIVAGCPSGWFDDGFVYYGPEKDWIRSVFSFGNYVQSGATDIQVGLGCVDMCLFWCGVYGTGQCHSHAPLIDNFDIYRIEGKGAQWQVRDIDLFQDNFAEDGTTTGTARIDMAQDVLPSENANFVPGDSTVVRVSDPEAGLNTDGSGWAAVYMYVAVYGPTASTVAGDPNVLTTDSFRWPYVGTTTDGFGTTWYCLRMDTSFTNGSDRTGAAPNAFCVDLNDSLFVPGDTISFIFCAESDDAPDYTRTYWTGPVGSEATFDGAAANADECTILPAGGWANGGDVLYVDGMNFRGAQIFFDTAFDQLGILDEVDRYDIRGPSSSVANRPGSRVVDPLQQILPCYRKIIWNTGNLDNGLIGDGTPQVEKSNDALMLFTFLENLAQPGGIYFNGDNIAEHWPEYGGSAVSLKSLYIQHNLIGSGDHTDLGIAISPLVIAEDNGCFDHVTGPDTLIAYGGCPIINNFDVMAPTAASFQEMRYDGGAAGQDGAVISQYTLNPDSVQVGVILSGFSYHYIRDDKTSGGLDRAHHMKDILEWLGNTVPDPTPATPTYRNSLSQNYPNPFNPTTTIDFTVKELAPVSVKIYNVRGQLVRTLANDRFEPGVTHQLEWNGRNNAGQSVSSGVYFYKLVTKNFTQTKKMVLLK